MMNQPMMHMVVKVSKLLAAVAAILVGLRQLGWDFWGMDFMKNNATVAMVVNYAFLVAGVVLLVHWAMCCCTKGTCTPEQPRR